MTIKDTESVLWTSKVTPLLYFIQPDGMGDLNVPQSTSTSWDPSGPIIQNKNRKKRQKWGDEDDDEEEEEAGMLDLQIIGDQITGVQYKHPAGNA